MTNIMLPHEAEIFDKSPPKVNIDEVKGILSIAISYKQLESITHLEKDDDVTAVLRTIPITPRVDPNDWLDQPLTPEERWMQLDFFQEIIRDCMNSESDILNRLNEQEHRAIFNIWRDLSLIHI